MNITFSIIDTWSSKSPINWTINSLIKWTFIYWYCALLILVQWICHYIAIIRRSHYFNTWIFALSIITTNGTNKNNKIESNLFGKTRIMIKLFLPWMDYNNCTILRTYFAIYKLNTSTINWIKTSLFSAFIYWSLPGNTLSI